LEINLNKIEFLFKNYLIHPAVSFNINILANLILKDVVFFFVNAIDKITTLNKLVCFNSVKFSANTVVLNCENSCSVCGGRIINN
jgi:hypothetical protein